LLILFVLAMPIASIAWTVTHEDIFKEPRDYCSRRSREGKSLFVRKAFYLFTCEYCFSHWGTIGVLLATGLRLGIRSERIEVSLKEQLREQAAEHTESAASSSGRQLRRASR
jgi:hypothetical protein